MADEKPQDRLKLGPRDGVVYPLTVKYCGHCSMPIEYCEYYPEFEKCKEWLEQHYPEDYELLKLREAEDEADGTDDKKRQKRGGKGLLRMKKKENEQVAKRIGISCTMRGKNKRVTVVAGLSTFNIDLRGAAKYFGNKFACGSSVTGDDELVIQGDVKEELFNVIPEKWQEVDKDLIEDWGEGKRQQQ